jgi:hypothetical protein
MANPFQDFIQLELPKRPFLETDSAEETVFVRRGVAPRQMATISLNDGEVLGKVGGVLQGVVPTTAEGVEHVQGAASATWTITHNKNNIKCVVQLVDENDDVIHANNIKIEPNTITITFSIPQDGRANVMFF